MPAVCSICFHDYDNSLHVPRNFSCGHTFCHQCLENLRTRSLTTPQRSSLSTTSTTPHSPMTSPISPSSSVQGATAAPPPPSSPSTPLSPSPTMISCPTCQVSHSILHIESLPKNFGLIETFIQQNLLEITQRCTVCDEPHEGTHQCLDCGQVMCGKLSRQHTKYNFAKDHRVVTLAEAEAVGNSLSSFMCLEHPTESYQFYDEICQQLLCLNCIQRTHLGHRFRPIAEIFDEMQQLQTKIRVNLSDQIQRLKSAEDATQDESFTLHVHFEELNNEINHYFRQLQQKLLEHKGRLQTHLFKLCPS